MSIFFCSSTKNHLKIEYPEKIVRISFFSPKSASRVGLISVSADIQCWSIGILSEVKIYYRDTLNVCVCVRVCAGSAAQTATSSAMDCMCRRSSWRTGSLSSLVWSRSTLWNLQVCVSPAEGSIEQGAGEGWGGSEPLWSVQPQMFLPWIIELCWRDVFLTQWRHHAGDRWSQVDKMMKSPIYKLTRPNRNLHSGTATRKTLRSGVIIIIKQQM